MEPIYIPPEELETAAAEAARKTVISGLRSGSAECRRVRKAAAALERVEKALQRAAGREGVEGAARWMLDNAYLLRTAAEEAAGAFAAAGKLRAAGGRALISVFAAGLLASGDGQVTEERLERYLRGWQSHTPLTRAELRLTVPALFAAALDALAKAYADDSPDAQRCGVLFTTVRTLLELELTDTLESADRADRMLRTDPAGIYPLMDRESRESYLRTVEKLARRYHMSEYDASRRAVELASRGETPRLRHVGFYLFEQPLGREQSRPDGFWYVFFNLTLPGAAALFIGLLFRSPAAGLLALLPLSQVVKDALDAIALRLAEAEPLPRLELKDGVPREGRTLCAVSVLLTGEEPLRAAARRLEEFRMASRDCGRELAFSLLCDLPESAEALSAADRALLDRAAEAVNALNERYGGGFFLFTRERRWSRDAGRFIPWERKRGAVLELCRLLAGLPSSLRVSAGEAGALEGTAYLLTLDTDTRLEPETARKLIGTALHPLNRPVIDRRRRLVVMGHGVLHPQMDVSLASAVKTDFARLFSPQGGGDPYGSRASEVYMDCFRRGGFAGKGLIHVRSFLDCLDGRFPEDTVLSHDALEGAYLRGGYVGDVELTDAFPSHPFAWLARQHRWVRGDWQNLPWILRAGRELPGLERWKLLDSLRRSLLQPALLASVAAFMILPSPGSACAACLSAWVFLAPLRRETISLLRGGRSRSLSPVLHGLSAGLLPCMIRLLWLPCTAWNDLSAAVTALWRMGVTHRRRLQWQTAEQSEARRSVSIMSTYKAMWPSVVFGTVLLAVSPLTAGLALGLCWLLSPLTAAPLGRARTHERALSENDRDWLRRRCAEMWRYFRDKCVPETNWLPPDNVQFSPPAEDADRVSPTNLGLALLSALCALELGAAKRQEVLALCEHMLTAAEKLPKWHGHLYNWYDTRTLEPLKPEYVSTVDSGNWGACLLACAEALHLQGAEALANRAETLREAMDFRPLYDEKRQLFLIGLAPGEERSAESRYDLLESEARLCSYMAVASGQVSRRHWQKLSRARVGCDGFRGMVSWSGTMFEYLMPELFLPLYESSNLGESARFAVYVQRKHAPGPEGLWGVSESAFNALDAAMHFRYKAHGIRALALRREEVSERVIAPYASFLALAVAPRAAMANLRAMEKRGLLGPYGFWEAVDFTPGRAAEGGCPVRSVMVHHLGMSMAAAANAVCGGVVRRWFLSDASMRAYTGLLQEKVPQGGALLRRRVPALAAPVKSSRETPASRTGEGLDPLRPDCAPLSNGAWSLLFTEAGVSRAQTGALWVYASPRFPAYDRHGVELWLERGGERVSLLPTPGSRADFSHEFFPDRAVISGSLPGLRWTVTVGVGDSEPGELRRVMLLRDAPAEDDALYMAFEPVLLPEKDERAHPSFARLGLFTAVSNGVLTVRRLARGTQAEQFLALAVSREAAFSSDRQRFPGRDGVLPFQPNDGWQSESLVCARVLPGTEESVCVRFAMAVRSRREAAVNSARALLSADRFFSMAEAVPFRQELSAAEASEAPALVSALLRGLAGEALRVPPRSRDELWALGISGDVPIHAVECARESSVPAAAAHLRRHALLGLCGVKYDLVFLTREDGDYRRACRTAVESMLERLDGGAAPGVVGGVHFASLDKDRDTLLSAAAIWTGEGGVSAPERLPRRYRGPVIGPGSGKKTAWRFDDDAAFQFETDGALPRRCWTNILTNGSLSWAATDAGTGSLWWENARECPLIPWSGDPLAVQGPELLWAELDGSAVSFFAAPGEPCSVRYFFGGAVWEKTVGEATLRLTAFIPRDKNVRVSLLESSRPVRVRWCAPMQLAPEREDAVACLFAREGERITVRNPRCGREGLAVYARCSAPWAEYAVNRSEYLCGIAEDVPRSWDSAICAGFDLDEKGAVVLLGTDDAPELLSPAAARAALDRCREEWRALVCRGECRGADEAMLPWLNGWAAYQAMAGRILGRSGVYQSGGAVGFRDQLQDRVNLLPLDPAGCREHVLVCCAHQFSEGDVQHWWHPGPETTDKGVRTRCADDLLWLPWAVCEYVAATGDESLCREETAFLRSDPLGPEERSRYETPEISDESGSVLEHCRRAVGLALRRGVGSHRLLLMGGGDWNDSFDDMGPSAESVWLTWFASSVLDRFAELLERCGETGGGKYAELSRLLGEAANEAWEEDHFLRGYYGDGEPLGSSVSGACRMDSIAQSFAAFCPWSDPVKVDRALDAALRELWDREHHRLVLYAPPFAPGDRSPGYASTYGPGFRENGGQYTHAAVWMARALFRAGRWQDGHDLLLDLALACRETEYLAEPFVLPADVSAAADTAGRAGWTWYTGSAGWWFRTAWEDMLGLSMREGVLSLTVPEEAARRGWSVRFRRQDGTAAQSEEKEPDNS